MVKSSQSSEDQPNVLKVKTYRGPAQPGVKSRRPTEAVLNGGYSSVTPGFGVNPGFEF